jgi:HlyD family secretion protein
MKEKINKFVEAVGKKRGLLTTLGILAIAAIFVGIFWGKEADASDYITARAERGSVAVTVSATGTVQALTTVLVGSQASGTVAWLGADFNSEVKRGQVIARLDSSTFEAQIENARASVANAEAGVQAAMTEITNQNANVQAAKANLEVARVQSQDASALVSRYEGLSNVLPSRDIEAARAQAGVAAARLSQASAQVAQAEAARRMSDARLAQARAQLAQARAQLEQAQANLSHTVITSPIDGIVVSRDVDVGQTVAASLQAPTLFTIANDLTQMQVLALIDEADVGQIREGVKANFTVDAFPGQDFNGQVLQVRLNAQNQQNVVTYTAVVEVSNPELKLRPGMTANLTFSIQQRDDVLTVPNAALRFRPALSEEEQQELRARLQSERQQRADRRQGQQGRRAGGARGDQNGSGANQETPEGSTGERRERQTVWVLVGGNKLEPRFVRTGLTNGRVTEIVAGNLQEGETVVTGKNETDSANRSQQTASPFGQQPRGGFGGGRRR